MDYPYQFFVSHLNGLSLSVFCVPFKWTSLLRCPICRCSLLLLSLSGLLMCSMTRCSLLLLLFWLLMCLISKVFVIFLKHFVVDVGHLTVFIVHVCVFRCMCRPVSVHGLSDRQRGCPVPDVSQPPQHLPQVCLLSALVVSAPVFLSFKFCQSVLITCTGVCVGGWGWGVGGMCVCVRGVCV